VSRWSRRIAKIKKARHAGVTGYRLADGSVKYIRSKGVFEAYREACEGIDTPRARVMLTAVECVTERSGRLHEWAQALSDGPTVAHQPTPERNTDQ
jgi:hypothetical protein